MFPGMFSDVMSWTLFYAILMTSLSYGVSERLPDLTLEQKNSVQDPRHSFFERLIQENGEPLFWDDVIPSVGIVKPLVELTEQQTEYVVKKYRVKAIPAIVKSPGFKLNYNASPQITPDAVLLISPPSSSKSSTQHRTSVMTTSPSKVSFSTFAGTTKVSLPTTMETSLTTSPVKTSVQMTTQLTSNASSKFTSPRPSTPYKPTSSSFKMSTSKALFSSPKTQSSTDSVLSTSSTTSLNSHAPTPSALFSTHARSTLLSSSVVSTQSSTQDVATDSKSSSIPIATQLSPSTFESSSMILSTNPTSTKSTGSTPRTRPLRQYTLTSFVPLVSLKPSSTRQPILTMELLKGLPSSSPNPPSNKFLSTKREEPSTQSALTSMKLTSGSETVTPLTQSPTKADDELSYSSKQFSPSSSTYSINPLESRTERPSSTPRLLSTLFSFLTTTPFASPSSAAQTQSVSTESTAARLETSVSSPKSSPIIIPTNAPTSRKPPATLLLKHSSSLSPLSSTSNPLSFSFSTSSSRVSTSDSTPLTTWSSPTNMETTVKTGDLLAESWCQTERLNTSIVTPACKGRDYKTVAYVVTNGKLNQVISHVEVPMKCDPDPDGPCYGVDNSCTCCLTKASIDIVSVIIETGEMLQTSQNFAQCLCC